MDCRSVVEQYLVALSSRDPDSVTMLVTDDFVNEQTSSLGLSTNGRPAYCERLPGFLEQFNRLDYEIVDSIVQGNKVAVRYRMRAEVNQHQIDIPGVMLFEVRDGLIARRTDLWDSLTFLRQTGAVEERTQER